ncbi:hypothetical protein HELRODRAFT_113810 [Helobdella robusta]|uniref:Protein-tyrosine-phosphatase n=1 Tax=Helobdella robusta TaxID=6412 RepID=T1EFX0_HELRO|nr:hypothetical protein HELRODRAFT_113810 [Helobdella robusta]ESN98495.1 hypothetical protein HELRODRAFT_113810 [Helobdella robusta]
MAISGVFFKKKKDRNLEYTGNTSDEIIPKFVQPVGAFSRPDQELSPGLDTMTVLIIAGGSCFIVISLIVMFFLIRKNRGLPMLPTCLSKKETAITDNRATKKNAAQKMADIKIENLQDYIDECKLKGIFVSEFEKLPDDDVRSCFEGSKPENADKNRFANILPFDDTLVKLLPDDGDDDKSDDGHDNSGVEGDGGDGNSSKKSSQYINASFIKGYKKQSRAYIATQYPLMSTFTDFWRMVWQREVNVIIILTPLIEEPSKCDQYWPENTKEPKLIEPFSITMIAEETFSHYILRRLLLQHSKFPDDSGRSIIQLHYISWHDKSSPRSAVSLLNFISVARYHRQQQRCPPQKKMKFLSPLLVHCSAGVGRTGTYVALDYLLDQMIRENQVSVFNCVCTLRKQRMCMVQVQEQYDFIYNAINEASVLFNTGVPCGDFLRHFCSKDSGYYRDGYNIDPKLKTVSQQFDLLEKLRKMKPKKFMASNSSFKKDSTSLINVTTIDGYKLMDEFSMTTAPSNDASICGLWKFIMKQRIKFLILLESPSKIPKIFWPSKFSLLYDSIEVSVKSESKEFECLMVRHFDVTETGNKYIEPLTVTQFELIGSVWKSGSPIPTNNNQLLKVIDRISMSSIDKFMLICNDGFSRCGLMATCMHMIDMMKASKLVDPLLASRYVISGRQQAIGTLEEFRWLYSLASDYMQMKGPSS